MNLIINNRRQLSDVPSLIHDQVKELLLDMELPELTE
ncbi:CD1375 family protein [Enterococcus sp. 22-H-5-01]